MSSRDWNLGGGSPRLKATCSLQVEAHSSKGQAFWPSPQSRLHPAIMPEVMASSHQGTCLAKSRCIAISMLRMPHI